MIEIPLGRGLVALIDDEDAHLAEHRWHAGRGRHDQTWYAQRTEIAEDGTQRTVRLHRAVLGVNDPTVEVDHRDGNGLDCRRGNLRAASHAENRANSRRRSDNRSGFKGVSRHRQTGKWQAEIKARGRRFYLGLYATADAAARGYDAAARDLHGQFARLNFPEEPAA